ncbi:four helix bundle protein [bacterium]|nr:four helix bundle protein [bacterium]
MSTRGNNPQEEGFFFERLEVYCRSLKFSIELCQLASTFPVKFSRIRDQLIGAAISIPLNIAEGSGRRSSKEKVNFYKISRTSLFECIPILELCLKLKLLDQKRYRYFRKEDIELSKMINGLIKSL